MRVGEGVGGSCECVSPCTGSEEVVERTLRLCLRLCPLGPCFVPSVGPRCVDVRLPLAQYVCERVYVCVSVSLVSTGGDTEEGSPASTDFKLWVLPRRTRVQESNGKNFLRTTQDPESPERASRECSGVLEKGPHRRGKEGGLLTPYFGDGWVTGVGVTRGEQEFRGETDASFSYPKGLHHGTRVRVVRAGPLYPLRTITGRKWTEAVSASWSLWGPGWQRGERGTTGVSGWCEDPARRPHPCPHLQNASSPSPSTPDARPAPPRYAPPAESGRGGWPRESPTYREDCQRNE